MPETKVVSKYTMFVGINYYGTDQAINREFNPDSDHQCGAVISKLLNDEPDAINFQILIQRNDSGDKEPSGGDTKR